MAQRMKRALLALSAGAMLFSASSAFGGEREPHEPVEQTGEGDKEGRLRRDTLQAWLRTMVHERFANDFSIGDASREHPALEEYGLYYKGVHLGDIHSDTRFDPTTLREKAAPILRENGFQPEEAMTDAEDRELSKGVEYVEDASAAEILAQWGGRGVVGSKLDYGGRTAITFDENTRRVTLSGRTGENGPYLSLTVHDADGTVTTVDIVDKEMTNLQIKHSE